MAAPMKRIEDIEAVRVEGAGAGKRRVLVKVPDEVMMRILRNPEPKSVSVAQREKELSYLPEEVRARMLEPYVAIQRRHQLRKQLLEMYVAKGYAAYECDEDDIINYLGGNDNIYYVRQEEEVAQV